MLNNLNQANNKRVHTNPSRYPEYLHSQRVRLIGSRNVEECT